MASSIGGILLVAMFGLNDVAGDEIQVSIDVLPGESRNIVDPEAPDVIPVAVLGSPSFDPHAVEPESLRLLGAPVVKNERGDTHAFEDANGDGRLDLVVWFAASQIRLADADTRAVLEGTTRNGSRIVGRDAIRTITSARRSNDPPPSGSAEKLRPITAEIAVLEAEPHHRLPIAILAGPGFDPRDLDIDSIRLNGRPIAKGDDGELTALEDINGDGLLDVVVSVGDAAGSRPVALSAATKEGRSVLGGLAEEIAPIEVIGSGDSIRSGSLGAITIVDAAPASPYPSTITLSGINGVVSKLRVTLNGLSHTCYGDLDVLLVGPTGQSIVLMSDVGGCGNSTAPTNLTFDDFAPTSLASGVLASTGSYRPFSFGNGDVFSDPAPVPSAAVALSAFNGTNPNGEWKLYVMDDATFDTGAIQDGWTLDLVVMTQVCNGAPITMPRSSGDPNESRADVYPSQMFLSGLPTQIAKVSVTLKGLTHPSPDDLELLLVSSLGTHSVTLMGYAGSSTPVTDLDITFDDDAATFLPDGALAPWSAVYRPATYGPMSFPPPAPSPGYYDDFSFLNGYDPNGLWQLYVVDHTPGGTGVIAEGWCLNITATAAADSCQMGTITIPAGAPGTTVGPAAPYPRAMNVTGNSGVIQRAKVKLLGLTHTFPDDLDIVVQAPSGRSMWLTSDAGGADDVTNLDVSFESGNFPQAPDSALLGPGPYYPTDYENGDALAFPAPTPAPPEGFSLYNELPNGTWKLWVADDTGGDVGSIAGWCLSFELYDPSGFRCSNGANPLTVPAGAPSVSFGPATPYPWPITVAQEGLIIDRVVVHVWSLSHTYADDLDLLVVGPQGQKALLMSDAGGPFGVFEHFLAFDDQAVNVVPDSDPLPLGSVRPANYAGGDSEIFPAPAPAGPYGTTLSVFSGTDPRGVWSLYVQDDAGGDVGSAMQWCLEIVPRYPSGEANNLAWRGTSKNSLQWDAAPNASVYEVLRGTPAQLGSLLTNGEDHCIAAVDHRLIAEGLDLVPPPGSFYWYLVVGETGNLRGPAGRARVAGSETARTVDSGGSCAAP